MASDGVDVKVYIYDLSRGMARSMSQMFLGKQIDGIWHTGIVVFGQEYFFGGGGGIECCPPGGTIMGQPDTIHSLGKTQVPFEMFMEYLADASKTSFRGDKYHLLEHNCNTFSSELAQFLTGNDIPSHITGLPREVLSTPFGQMIKPFIDSMSVQPSGGHAVFPQGNSAPSSQSQKQAPPTGASSQSQNKPRPTAASSTNNNHSSTSSGDSCKLEPMIYREELPKLTPWNERGVGMLEQAQIKEVYEYLGQSDDTYSLCRDHMTTLYRLVLNQETGCADCAELLLSRLALKPDMIQMLAHDPQSMLPDLFTNFETFVAKTKTGFLKMMTNICITEAGHKLLLNAKYQKLTVSTCVSCLVSTDDSDMTALHTTLSCCYNLSLKKVSEDVALELGSALLNVVDRIREEQPGFHLLTAISQLMSSHQEVKGLASVLGVNFEHLRGKSDRLNKLCDTIQKKL